MITFDDDKVFAPTANNPTRHLRQIIISFNGLILRSDLLVDADADALSRHLRKTIFNDDYGNH